MKSKTSQNHVLNTILILVLFASSGFPALAQNPNTNPIAETSQAQWVVAQVYFSGTDELNQLASYLDIWEVNQEKGYLVAMLSPDQFASLVQAGYKVVIDESKTASLNQPLALLPGQSTDSIPGYPCYRTVEDTYSSMDNLAISYPNLVEVFKIGNSWDKVTPGGPAGYDIKVMRLTNEKLGVIGQKPTFFLMAEIHSREYVTAETALRFAEYLVSNYDLDPDITWLLDYYRIYIVTMTNPDGRKFAEQGIMWRKNTNDVSGGGCSYPYYGVDLNRNHTFKWNHGGSSSDPCDETYMGPSAGSEPEVNAIESFVKTIFTDQRGSGDTDPVPAYTTGVFVTLHSAAGLVLWPWGWSASPAPNSTQLQTLGRRLAYFNSYTPEQSYQLYQTSGSSDDFAYGELGVASYTFEMGTTFFQSCSSFENTIYPNNRKALIYAFKSARLPYMNPNGPDSLNVSVAFNSIPAGVIVTLTGIANDTRYNNSNGYEPTQAIQAAHFSIDNPSWIPGTLTYLMDASDGIFDEKVESIQANLDTTGLAVGKHMIYVESKDANGNWGVPGAVFLDIIPTPLVAEFTSNSPVQQGQSLQFTNLTTGILPISYTWDFGDGIGTSTETNPVYLYPDLGNYLVTLQATSSEDTDSISHTVTVEPATINNVDLTLVNTNTIFTGDVVNFYADIFPETAAKPYTYTINYGDDSTITSTSSLDQLILSHIFSTPGYYTVQFWAKNNVMSVPVTDSVALIVSIPNSPPDAEFISNSPGPLGQPIKFINQTYGSAPLSFLWNFGDGVGTSTETNPSYYYLNIGSYTVTLVATNTFGMDSMSHIVSIQLVPISVVTLTQVTSDPIDFGDSVTFRADLYPDNAGKPYSYNMIYDDGIVDTSMSSMDPLLLNHIFYSGGDHYVQIWVWNAGMSTSITASIDVYVNYKFFLPVTSK